MAPVWVLDWNLPCLNGDGVAEQLRAHLGDGVPILLVSATTGDGLIERARRVRAARVLAKPFEADDLLEAVRLSLGHGHAAPLPD